jgi:hypothetical protein
MMSGEEEPVGLKVGEKFFGLLVIIVGIIVFYFAFTSQSDLSLVVPSLPVLVPGIFLFFGAVLMLIGVLFIFAKEQEE